MPYDSSNAYALQARGVDDIGSLIFTALKVAGLAVALGIYGLAAWFGGGYLTEPLCRFMSWDFRAATNDTRVIGSAVTITLCAFVSFIYTLTHLEPGPDWFLQIVGSISVGVFLSLVFLGVLSGGAMVLMIVLTKYCFRMPEQTQAGFAMAGGTEAGLIDDTEDDNMLPK